jgi:hypothetical protein
MCAKQVCTSGKTEKRTHEETGDYVSFGRPDGRSIIPIPAQSVGAAGSGGQGSGVLAVLPAQALVVPLGATGTGLGGAVGPSAGEAGAQGAANQPRGVVIGQGSGPVQPNIGINQTPNTGIGQPNTGIGQPNNALNPNTGLFDPTRTPGGTNIIFGTNRWWSTTNWRSMSATTNPGLLPGQNQSGVLRPSGTLGGTNMNVLPGRGVGGAAGVGGTQTGVGSAPGRPGALTPGTTSTGPGGTTLAPRSGTPRAPGTSAGGGTTR